MTEWVSPRGGAHVMYAAQTDARDADGNELLSAYVVRRPGGTWATLLVNKDPARSYRVTLAFAGGRGDRHAGPSGTGRRTVISYSAANYAWHADSARGQPSRSDPPTVRALRGGAPVVVPPYSLTVIREFDRAPRAPWP